MKKTTAFTLTFILAISFTLLLLQGCNSTSQQDAENDTQIKEMDKMVNSVNPNDYSQESLSDLGQ